MKIAEVTPRFPPNIGGVEQHVFEISRRLNRRHDVEIWTADAPGPDEIEGLPVHRTKSFGDKNYMFSVDLISANFDADVLHVHNYHAFPAIETLLTSDLPSVFTTHYHGGSKSAFRNLSLKLFKRIGLRAINAADRLIAVSEWEADQLEMDFGRSPTTINHGLDYDKFYPTTETQDFVLVVGRLEEYKNVHLVMQALADVDLDLVVVGQGEQALSLRRLAADLGIYRRVTFIEEASPDELRDLYSAASVYVNMSTYEAFGMTVGEALACGTPAVVAPFRGLLRWMDTTGVSYTDARDPNVGEMIEASLDKQVDRRPLPSWSEVSKQTEAVLQSA